MSIFNPLALIESAIAAIGNRIRERAGANWFSMDRAIRPSCRRRPSANARRFRLVRILASGNLPGCESAAHGTFGASRLRGSPEIRCDSQVNSLFSGLISALIPWWFRNRYPEWGHELKTEEGTSGRGKGGKKAESDEQRRLVDQPQRIPGRDCRGGTRRMGRPGERIWEGSVWLERTAGSASGTSAGFSCARQ